MRPTVKDLEDIWMFTYARASLIEAANYVAELDKVAPKSIQYRALIDAAVIAYGRPFTACWVSAKRKVVPLKDVPIPEHLAEAHEHARNLRNTMVGHKDATPSEGYTATPNIVLVEIDRGNFGLNTAMLGEMGPELKEALRELCPHFVNHCEANLRRLKKVYLSEVVKNPPGVYELVISEPPADWLVPFQHKDGADFRK
jgi:hypothetical protein